MNKKKKKKPHTNYWDKEGLVWRGDSPPSKKEAHRLGDDWDVETDWFHLPHEHYIPANKYKIRSAILTLLKRESPQYVSDFVRFFDSLNALYQHRFNQLRDELAEDYSYFNPENSPGRRRNVPKEVLRFRERRFLSNLLFATKIGNYSTFGDRQLQLSKQHQYLFDLRVDITTLHYEKSWLERFRSWANSSDPDAEKLRARLLEDKQTVDEFFCDAPVLKNRAMIFWRGIEREYKKKGALVSLPLKLGLVARRMVLEPLLILITLPIKPLYERFKPKYQDESLFEELYKHYPWLRQKAKDGMSVGEESGKIFEHKWIRRLNLSNQPFVSLLQPAVMQEPSMREFLFLYKEAPTKKTFWQRMVSMFRETEENKARPEDIHIKVFKRVPLGDFKSVMPYKHVSIKYHDLLLILLAAKGGLLTLLTGISQAQFSTALAASFFSVSFAMFLSYLNTRRKYKTILMTELYNKSKANNLAALHYLVNQIESQDTKEALLAYFVLWYKNQSMTEKQLDAAVESFLHKELGMEVDFEVDDALNKVVSRSDSVPASPAHPFILPLIKKIEYQGQTFYQAEPIETVLQHMHQKWTETNPGKVR